MNDKTNYKLLIEMDFDSARPLPEVNFAGNAEAAGHLIDGLQSAQPDDIDETKMQVKINLTNNGPSKE